MRKIHPLFRSKFRVLTLISVVFVAQCCCCFLPVGYQVQRDAPQSQQVMDTLSYNLELLFKSADGAVYFSK